MRTLKLASVYLLLGASIGLQGCSISGRALDAKSHEPIAGVRMTLQCDRSQGLEGSRTIRKITRVTDSMGRYIFYRTEIWDCQFRTLFGEKEGYHSVGSNDLAVDLYMDPNLNRIPTIEYFMKDSDWVWMQLERGVALASGSSPSLYQGESPEATYTRWYTQFAEARRIATAPKEVEYVRGHYCPMLRSTYTQLSPEAKARMTKLRSQHRENGQWVDVKTTDYDQEVVPFCGFT
jgi:hypothetical protein